MKKPNRKFLNPGRFVRVKWDDIGAEDGIVIAKRDKQYLIFGLAHGNTHWVDLDQIVQFGNNVQAKYSGLEA